MARCNCSPRCSVCGDGPCDCTCTDAEKKAHLTQPTQSVDVADVRLLLECVKDEHGGDHFEAGCKYCAAFDRLTAALQEKGNG